MSIHFIWLTVGCRTEDSEKDPSVEEGTLIIDADNDGYPTKKIVMIRMLRFIQVG